MPAEEIILNFQEENPKRKGSKAFDKYDLYKWATCSSEFIEEGGTKADLKNDIQRGFCILESPASECPEPAEDIAEFSKVPTPVASDEEFDEEVWAEDDWVCPEPESEQEDKCVECFPDAPGSFKCSLCAPTPIICAPCIVEDEVPFSAIIGKVVVSPKKGEIFSDNIKTPVKKAPVKKAPVKKVTPDNCKCYARIFCGVRDKEYQSEYLQGNFGQKFMGDEENKVVYMSLPQMRCNNKSKDGDYCGRHGKEAEQPRGLRHGDIRDKPKDFLNKGHINHFLGFHISENVLDKITDLVNHDGAGKWEWIPDKFRDSEDEPRAIMFVDRGTACVE